MKPKEILAASFLDIVFDERNKEYGAYDLRVTYPGRVIKAMLFVFIFIALIYGGIRFAGKFEPRITPEPKIIEVTLSNISPDVKKPDPIVEQPKKPDVTQVKTERFTPPVITDDNKVKEVPPSVTDLITAQVSDKTREGADYENRATPTPAENTRPVLETPKTVEPEIVEVADIPAKYDGNWGRFLTNNLRGEVPVDNGAPAGRYTVIIQFVVDKDGSISDIKPLTKAGYGMEEEAMRVLRKAKGWTPGIYRGHEVKSYHRQPITFEVLEG